MFSYSSPSSIFLFQSFPRCALNRPSQSSPTPNIPSYSGVRWSRTGTRNRSGSKILLRPRLYSQRSVVASAQSNALRVFQTALKVAKDGIEAGTNFIPDSVPRPLAKIGVTGVLGVVTLFLLKSFLSSLFFLLAMMGVIYLAFISLNKDERPRGGGDTSFTTDDESLEEARRIMEKYK
ncbi:hypothetical protein ZOSMA_43G00630 [Zostera marina]|uniref:Transmembrane protein n=1 Tax=Zostera marina TaxID=29655 RepID=A0A0K9P1E7_ZOSMR|nr:hypothetical protein ZOSMA_43G00630 [Zostera marina]